MGVSRAQSVTGASTYRLPMEEHIEILNIGDGRSVCNLKICFNTNNNICHKIVIQRDGMSSSHNYTFFNNIYRYSPQINRFEYENQGEREKPCPMGKDNLETFLGYLKEARVKIEEKYTNGQYADRKISDLIDNIIKETQTAIKNKQ